MKYYLLCGKSDTNVTDPNLYICYANSTNQQIIYDSGRIVNKENSDTYTVSNEKRGLQIISIPEQKYKDSNNNEILQPAVQFLNNIVYLNSSGSDNKFKLTGQIYPLNFNEDGSIKTAYIVSYKKVENSSDWYSIFINYVINPKAPEPIFQEVEGYSIQEVDHGFYNL